MPLSVFDLDHTLLEVNSSFSFYVFLLRKRFFSIRTLAMTGSILAGYLCKIYSPYRLHEKIFERFLKGKKADRLKELAFLFAQNICELLCPAAGARLREAEREGHYVLLLSNSPDFLVAPIAAQLGIDHFFGSSYIENSAGALEQIAWQLDGRRKAEIMQKKARELGVPKEDVYAYSDSIWDLPFLEAAGKPCVVRGDRKLLKIAKSRGWEVIL